jgi:predicted ATPase
VVRIRSIQIANWRHFQNIHIQIGAELGLVCIVGANGTGKSHLLELIGACAHKLGLSPGIGSSRGDPFSDQHDFSLEFYVAPGVSDTIDTGLASHAGFDEWDRTLKLVSYRDSVKGHSIEIIAGGVSDPHGGQHLAAQIVQRLSSSEELYFLSLDADRAYPNKTIQSHELGQAYETDWEGREFTRGRSFMITSTLYDEWMKYFLGRENRAATELLNETRAARLAGERDPVFVDHFKAYSEALKSVLPHLVFTGVDTKKRMHLFNTTGLQLSFNQLSGGEREIAFLVGQIDRFGLRRGLFLLDEPELHLNSDLIRTWVEYLTGTVETGQIWLATHSLEAVEAAGQNACFVLERDEQTRKVKNLARLDTLPVLAALSRAVGTPAFSIAKLRFVFVEGEEEVGERERFRKLAGTPTDVRFMEGGSCTDVTRRVASIKSLAKESGAEIRIGGILDRDFRSADEILRHASVGVYVLQVHEVENFFLAPSTLESLLNQNGLDGTAAKLLIVEAADERAGSWIFQHAMSSKIGQSLPEMASPAKDRVKTLGWAEISVDCAAAVKSIVQLARFDGDCSKRFTELLGISVKAYERRRQEIDLWKFCEGKQVLNQIARKSGYSGTPALMSAAYALWQKSSSEISPELIDLRKYLTQL